MGRKQMRVPWTTTYGDPPPSPEEGGSGDEVDDVPRSEEEHPTGTAEQYPVVSTNTHPPPWPVSKEVTIDCYGC